MSRTTPPRLRALAVPALALALALVIAAPAGAALPARWLIAARPSAAAARLAHDHGARALRLPGAFDVPTGRARALAVALRRAGLLRYSEPDAALARQSAFEGPGTDQGWTRGVVVAPGLTPPPAFAPIGLVDDVVDTSVADVSQATILKSSPTKGLSPTSSPETAHGTEVASVAAARADGQGVIGIAPGAPLLSFGYRTLSCAEVVDGILDLVDAGARVVNLSFSTDTDCHTLQLATAAAFGEGAVVVAAAGNEQEHDNPVVYPAAYPHVLGVGALDTGLAPAFFSSTGSGVELAAPGESVPVAVPPALDQDGTADGVTRADGTSFAAPIVSGVASWLIAARPKLTAGQYADLLRVSAKDLGAPGWDPSTGFGLVDLAAALAAPVPRADPGEPNDTIDLVDGSALGKANPYIYTGGAARTVKASVTSGEDPVDVYRVRLRAGGRATVRLTPAGGAAADLYAYAGRARSLAATPVARSRKPGVATDVVRLRDRGRRAETFYVAVRVPAGAAHVLDDPYILKLSRGR